MSIKVMNAVWEHSPAKGSELLLLLALADSANDSGLAYPSVTTLAQKIRMGKRNTQYLLKKLEADGLIAIGKGAGLPTTRGATNRYRLLLPDPQLPMFSPAEIPEKVIHRGAKAIAPQKAENTGANFAPHTQENADGVQNGVKWGATAIAPKPKENHLNINDLSISEFWLLALTTLRGQMTKATFNRLLAGSELTESEPGRYVVLVTSEAAAAWLTKDYAARIAEALQLAGAKVEALAIREAGQ